MTIDLEQVVGVFAANGPDVGDGRIVEMEDGILVWLAEKTDSQAIKSLDRWYKDQDQIVLESRRVMARENQGRS